VAGWRFAYPRGTVRTPAGHDQGLVLIERRIIGWCVAVGEQLMHLRDVGAGDELFLYPVQVSGGDVTEIV